MIKLIAIDLDGTLVNSNHQVSQENIQAIHYANQQGVKVVICTGRPYSSTYSVIEEIGLSRPEDYVVIFNGAQIRQADNGEVIYERALTYDDFKIWYHESQRLDLPINVIDSQWVYEPDIYPDGYESVYVKKITTAPSKVVDYNYFNEDNHFNKFVICVESSQYLDQQLELMNPHLKENYQLVKSYPFQLEVGLKGVNKGSALAYLGQRLKIDASDMLAIGDQNNDHFMLEYVGHGAAVGNAIAEIKAIAEYVGPSNNDHGVADIIYHYLK